MEMATAASAAPTPDRSPPPYISPATSSPASEPIAINSSSPNTEGSLRLPHNTSGTSGDYKSFESPLEHSAFEIKTRKDQGSSTFSPIKVCRMLQSVTSSNNNNSGDLITSSSNTGSRRSEPFRIFGFPRKLDSEIFDLTSDKDSYCANQAFSEAYGRSFNQSKFVSKQDGLSRTPVKKPETAISRIQEDIHTTSTYLCTDTMLAPQTSSVQTKDTCPVIQVYSTTPKQLREGIITSPKNALLAHSSPPSVIVHPPSMMISKPAQEQRQHSANFNSGEVSLQRPEPANHLSRTSKQSNCRTCSDKSRNSDNGTKYKSITPSIAKIKSIKEGATKQSDLKPNQSHIENNSLAEVKPPCCKACAQAEDYSFRDGPNIVMCEKMNSSLGDPSDFCFADCLKPCSDAILLYETSQNHRMTSSYPQSGVEFAHANTHRGNRSSTDSNRTIQNSSSSDIANKGLAKPFAFSSSPTQKEPITLTDECSSPLQICSEPTPKTLKVQKAVSNHIDGFLFNNSPVNPKPGMDTSTPNTSPNTANQGSNTNSVNEVLKNQTTHHSSVNIQQLDNQFRLKSSGQQNSPKVFNGLASNADNSPNISNDSMCCNVSSVVLKQQKGNNTSVSSNSSVASSDSNNEVVVGHAMVDDSPKKIVNRPEKVHQDKVMVVINPEQFKVASLDKGSGSCPVVRHHDTNLEGGSCLAKSYDEKSLFPEIRDCGSSTDKEKQILQHKYRLYFEEDEQLDSCSPTPENRLSSDSNRNRSPRHQGQQRSSHRSPHHKKRHSKQKESSHSPHKNAFLNEIRDEGQKGNSSKACDSCLKTSIVKPNVQYPTVSTRPEHKTEEEQSLQNNKLRLSSPNQNSNQENLHILSLKRSPRKENQGTVSHIKSHENNPQTLKPSHTSKHNGEKDSTHKHRHRQRIHCHPENAFTNTMEQNNSSLHQLENGLKLRTSPYSFLQNEVRNDALPNTDPSNVCKARIQAQRLETNNNRSPRRSPNPKEFFSVLPYNEYVFSKQKSQVYSQNGLLRSSPVSPVNFLETSSPPHNSYEADRKAGSEMPLGNDITFLSSLSKPSLRYNSIPTMVDGIAYEQKLDHSGHKNHHSPYRTESPQTLNQFPCRQREDSPHSLNQQNLIQHSVRPNTWNGSHHHHSFITPPKHNRQSLTPSPHSNSYLVSSHGHTSVHNGVHHGATASAELVTSRRKEDKKPRPGKSSTRERNSDQDLKNLNQTDFNQEVNNENSSDLSHSLDRSTSSNCHSKINLQGGPDLLTFNENIMSPGISSDQPETLVTPKKIQSLFSRLTSPLAFFSKDNKTADQSK